MKISVVMIVKNEGELLARCLDSVRGFDELVICDTGSDDRTVEIARKYTDKVFEDYRWDDNFAEARNHALKKCTGDWVLSIDADEVLEAGGVKKIRAAVVRATGLALNVTSVAENNTNSHFFPRLFKNNGKVFWKGAIHNYLNVTTKEKVDVKIFYGYSPAHKKDPDRALRILKKEVAENLEASRELYYLGREYTYRKDWVSAIVWLTKYVSKPRWSPEWADGFYLLAFSYWWSQQGEKARDACLQALKINANFKAAIELMAEMSGPKNKKRWLEFAKTASNEDVLFTRASA